GKKLIARSRVSRRDKMHILATSNFTKDGRPSTSFNMLGPFRLSAALWVTTKAIVMSAAQHANTCIRFQTPYVATLSLPHGPTRLSCQQRPQWQQRDKRGPLSSHHPTRKRSRFNSTCRIHSILMHGSSPVDIVRTQKPPDQKEAPDSYTRLQTTKMRTQSARPASSRCGIQRILPLVVPHRLTHMLERTKSPSSCSSAPMNACVTSGSISGPRKLMSSMKCSVGREPLSEKTSKTPIQTRLKSSQLMASIKKMNLSKSTYPGSKAPTSMTLETTASAMPACLQRPLTWDSFRGAEPPPPRVYTWRSCSFVGACVFAAPDATFARFVKYLCGRVEQHYANRSTDGR
ncbi:hypothetical protein Vretifemale_15739, partial [Volvox reticuliferus]